MRFALITAFAAASFACGGEKPPSADSTPKAEATIGPSPSPSDTLKPATMSAADTVKPKSDTSGAKKKLDRIDSAFGPKAGVDASGKPVPIKKP